MSNILETRNTIFYIIWCCLFVALSWTLVALATSILNLLPTGKEIETRKSKSDHLGTSNIPCNAGNQFLAQCPVGNECNHADFVPVQETVTSGSNLRQFASKSLTSGLDYLKNDCDDSMIVEMIHPNFDNEIIMTEPLNGSSNDIEQKTGFQWVFNTEKRNEKMTIHEEGDLLKMYSSCGVDQLKEEYSNDVTTMTKRASIDQRDKNYAKNTFDHANEYAMSKNEEERLSNLEMKIEEDRDATVSRALAAKFLALILQESSPFRMDSTELRKERTMAFGTNASIECGQPCGKHTTENGRKADGNESRVFDKFGESLTRTNDSKICSQEGNDYPEERFGVVPEKEANCMEEESAMYPSRNATQSRFEGREEEEKVGPPPERNPLKNGRGTESTNFLGRPQSACYGKEEKDLNAMIQRIIFSELKKHRMKKQTMLKRAYSDTAFSNQSSKTRTGLFSPKGRTFFHDLLELEESTRTKVESTSGSECAVTRIDETIVERVESTKQNEIRSKEDVEVDVPPADRAHDAINFFEAPCKIDSTILLERKVSVHCLAETEQSMEIENSSMAEERIQLNKSTQTEYVYVIRAIRSCPLRKRNLPLRFQLHLTSGREAVSSKTVFASMDCSRFVFRKASDNLIYEKGKASGSPSYVPNPERFRWKYVMPSTVK